MQKFIQNFLTTIQHNCFGNKCAKKKLLGNRNFNILSKNIQYTPKEMRERTGWVQ